MEFYVHGRFRATCVIMCAVEYPLVKDSRNTPLPFALTSGGYADKTSLRSCFSKRTRVCWIGTPWGVGKYSANRVPTSNWRNASSQSRRLHQSEGSRVSVTSQLLRSPGCTIDCKRPGNIVIFVVFLFFFLFLLTYNNETSARIKEPGARGSRRCFRI